MELAADCERIGQTGMDPPRQEEVQIRKRTDRLGCMERQISNQQFMASCAACAIFGSPRVVLTGCKTNSRSAVTAEAAGSSPVVPATSIQCLTDLRSHQLSSLEDGSKPKNELVPLSLVVPEDPADCPGCGFCVTSQTCANGCASAYSAARKSLPQKAEKRRRRRSNLLTSKLRFLRTGRRTRIVL